MDELLKTIKKTGNKTYTLAQKIQECNNAGMKTRIPGYVEGLEKCQDALAAQISQLKNQI